MHAPHHDNKHDDSTFTFSFEFGELRKETISALFFDDNEIEATADTWPTQTALFIQHIKANLGELNAHVASVTPIAGATPTNDPLYSLVFVVSFDKAVEVQQKIEAFIRSLSRDLY
jgi:hypothetical protein